MQAGLRTISVAALTLAVLAGCSDPAAGTPEQTRMAEISVAELPERLAAGGVCELAGELANSGEVDIVRAELRLTAYLDGRPQILASVPVERFRRGETRPFSLRYRCDQAPGERRLRADMAGVPIRIVPR
jgi:hypothetical protein